MKLSVLGVMLMLLAAPVLAADGDNEIGGKYLYYALDKNFEDRMPLYGVEFRHWMSDHVSFAVMATRPVSQQDLGGEVGVGLHLGMLEFPLHFGRLNVPDDVFYAGGGIAFAPKLGEHIRLKIGATINHLFDDVVEDASYWIRDPKCNNLVYVDDDRRHDKFYAAEAGLSVVF